MATIRKKGDYQWHVQIRRKGYPSHTKTFMYREDAEKWARATERDMDAGMFTSAGDAERNTLHDLIKAFKSEFAPKHYRVRTDEKEAWRFQLARLDEALGDYSLAALDQKLIAGYRDKRLTGDLKRPSVSESTVRKELYMLSKVLGFAQTEKGITLPRGNPVEKIRKPSDGKGRERRLSTEEWQALEKECQASRNPWLWPAVQLAVETAMRQGDALLNTSSYTPEQISAAQAFVTNVANPVPTQNIPKDWEQTRQGKTFVAGQYVEQARASVAANSLNAAIAARTPIQGLGTAAMLNKADVSERELFESQVRGRFESPAWYKMIAGFSLENMMREIVKIRALQAQMDLAEYQRTERIEAVLATQLAIANKQDAELRQRELRAASAKAGR